MEVVKVYDDWTDWNGDCAPDWSAQWVSASKGKDLKNAKGSKDGKSGKSKGSKGVKGKEGSGVAFDNGWGGKGGKEKGKEGREGREGKGKRSKANIGNEKEGLPECQSVFVSCIKGLKLTKLSSTFDLQGKVILSKSIRLFVAKKQETSAHLWACCFFDWAGWPLQHLVQRLPMASHAPGFECFLRGIGTSIFIEVEVFHGISVLCKSIAGWNT